MHEPNDNDIDDIDRAYRAAVAATDDGAARRRRKQALLKALEQQDRSLPAPGSAAIEARWRPAAAWWRGAAAACVLASGALVVTHLRQSPDTATNPELRTEAAPPGYAAPTPPAARPADTTVVALAGAARADALAKAAPPRAPAAPVAPVAQAPNRTEPVTADAAPVASAEPQAFPALARATAARAGQAAGAGVADAAAPQAQDATHFAGKLAALAGPGSRSTGAALTSPRASLLSAVGRGDVEAARLILRSTDPGPDAERDADGRTALALAALRADVPMVTLLLASGADRLAPDRFGQTAQGHAEASGDAALRRAFGLP